MEEEACGAVSECQMVDDSMLTIFLLFIFSSELSLWPITSEAESSVAPSLMDWQFVQQRFPFWTWALVVVICIIIGGLTEATANILLPIMAEVARATEVRSAE